MRHLLLAVDRSDLVKCGECGRQPAVHAEDAVVDDGRQAEVVKHICAVTPHIDRAILAQAFVIEAINLRGVHRRA
eukprot:218628-Chlamydomonas_euryale.AAC.2